MGKNKKGYWQERNKNKARQAAQSNDAGGNKVTRDESVSQGRFNSVKTLSTGVPTGIVINPSQRNTAVNGWSSLYCCNGSFLDDFIVGEYLNLVDSTIYWRYYNKIRQTVNGYYISTDQFNKDKFRNWITAVVNGLQLYYNVEHIMAFVQNNPNQNPGVEWMNSQLTSIMRRKHRELRSKLNDCAIPPRIMNFINYMYQNFSMSVDPQAPILRINWKGVFNPGSTGATGINANISKELYETVLGALNDTDFGETNNLIASAFPDDFKANLTNVSSVPSYDRGFGTFWYNNGVVVKDDTVKFGNSVANDDTKFGYQLKTDSLDGLIYACWHAWRTGGTAGWQPGIFKPFREFTSSSKVDNCTHTYYDDSNTDPAEHGLKSIGNDPYMTNSCGVRKPASFASNTWTINFMPHNDTQLAQYHSLSNMQMAVNASIKYLFDTPVDTND